MPSGGKRQGAGRPKGTGKFGTSTRSIRVPEDSVTLISQYLERDFYQLPLYHSLVSAGFPTPGDDGIEEKLDLNQLLIKHPTATFFLRVAGSSMIDAGIYDGDILIVDRSLSPAHGKIVIAALNGELTVKRLHIENKAITLLAENPAYPPIEVGEGIDLHIWGVVTNVIHAV